MRLEIGHLGLECLLPAGFEDAAGARVRAEDLARRLPDHLAPRLAAAEPGGGTVLIRHLTFEVTLSLDCPADISLHILGDALLRAIALSLAGDGQGQARFASPAGHLAVFLRDLMDGDAWSLWYHKPFDGLRHLPIARAAATVLGRDAAMALAALKLLEPRRVEDLAALAGRDVIDRLMAECVMHGNHRMPDEGLTLAMWQAARQADAEFEAAFLAALAAGCEADTLPGEAAVAVARGLAAAAVALRRGAQTLNPNGGLDRHAGLAAIGSTPQVEAAVARAVARDSGGVARWREGTRLGGLFLLLRDLDCVAEFLPAACPGCGGLDAAQALRVLVLAGLADDCQAGDWFADGVWRGVMGLGREMSRAELLAWAAAVIGPRRTAETWLRDVRETVMRKFARRLPGFSESSPDYLLRNVLDVAASVMLSNDRLLVEFDRPPLDPVLALSGAGGWEESFGWTVPERIAVMRRR